ncbi:hypothetical protein [Longitalea luteola]|uniref:hypothetical protein n=1 Tax=Longitalea luteola TaxID=2812563 RepID=UPI001A97B8C7|nr:hypothetical protein [Longitalea luteola]
MTVTYVTIIVIRAQREYQHERSHFTFQVGGPENEPSPVPDNKKAPRKEPYPGFCKPSFYDKMCGAIEIVIKVIYAIGLLGGVLNSFISR